MRCVPPRPDTVFRRNRIIRGATARAVAWSKVASCGLIERPRRERKNTKRDERREIKET